MRKNLKKALADKLKMHKIGSGRRLTLLARQRLKDSRNAGKLAEKELAVDAACLLKQGNSGGPWEGKTVRLVVLGLTDLLRN